MYRLPVSALLSLLCFSALTFADDAQLPPVEQMCESGYKHQRLTLRHIEGKGIGYKDGYTTLEAFFAPTQETLPAILPFIDLRGHLFNNGKYAANVGLGTRWRWGCKAYGISGYYDYRDDKKGFHQASLGLECLGTRWEAHINGYLPLGNKTSSPYHPKFSHFAGNSLFLSQKVEFTMKGADAEVGIHFGSRTVDCYAGLGPYYYNGEIGSSAWGGKARLLVNWKDYAGFQLSGSADRIFHGIIQGELFVRLPFGQKAVIKKSPKYCASNCEKSLLLDRRMTQPVIRDEIIVLNKGRRTYVAINPGTDAPYVFWFVDNLSHSNGTFESPFNTLTAAQNASSPNDIIYVFPGDDLGTGMDAGIVLQNAQQLLGATIDHTIATSVGAISVPPQTGGNFLPLLSTTIGHVVTLANDNVVSGLFIQAINNGLDDGINGNGVNNTVISQNYMQTVRGQCVDLENATGKLVISDNIMSAATGEDIFIVNTVPVSNTLYLVQNNLIQSNFDRTVMISSTDGSNNTFQFTDNQFSDALFSITCSDTTLNAPNTFNVINNQFTSSGDSIDITLQGTGGTTNTFNVNNNLFTGANRTSLGLTNSQASVLNLNVNNNNFSAFQIINLALSNSSVFNGYINGNNCINTGGIDALFFSTSDNSIFNAVISGNSFYHGSTGVNLVNGTTSHTSISIVDNVFQSQISNGAGVFMQVGNDIQAAINNNTFLNSLSSGVQFFNDSGNNCLELNYNNSNLFPSAYSITVASGTLYFQQAGNQGQIVEVVDGGATLTPVTACP